jgi:alpha-glucosidase
MQVRNASSLTGDNVATWEHLWIANIQAKNVNFGMGFTGSDIGGFAEQPSGELYARWIQLGVFHPFAEHTRQVIMEIRSLGI